MSCQQLPEVNGLYHESVSNNVYIVYKYPPSHLRLVIEHGNLSKVITAICTSMFANPACDIKWESTIKHFKYSLLENFTSRQATKSKISFNATNEDYGKQIRCNTECQYFKNTLVNITTVIFAKKPKVVVYSTSVLPVLPNTTITLTCVANAHPVGNITWTMVETSYLKSSSTKSCLNASTCTYELITSDVEQVYSCYAQNEHGSDERSIVIVHESKYKEDLNGKAFDILGVTIGILGGIAFLFIVIVVMCLCLRRNQEG
ncbi:MAG-like protein, partial [Mya arenaria]